MSCRLSKFEIAKAPTLLIIEDHLGGWQGPFGATFSLEATLTKLEFLKSAKFLRKKLVSTN